MNILKKKPGAVLLPVSAVFIIFIALLIMLIDQKQSNNALILEYRASRVIDILLDLHVTGQDIEPAEIDENIIGYGIYNRDRSPVVLYGSAPEILPAVGSRDKMIYTGNRSITIIRHGDSALPPGAGEMMQRGNPNMPNRLRENRINRSEAVPMMPMMQKYQISIYIEYSNSSYISERRLIFLLVFLFVFIFTAVFILVLRLYRINQLLLVQKEHDKQLIQLGEAARTLAHEIRNPLGTLKIQRDLLSRKLPPEYDGNLQVIDRELKRLNLLVERVGDFLKNPLGRPERINLESFIGELYGCRDDVVLSSEASGTVVFFDRERLRTVLDNIVNNAVDSGGAAELFIGISGARVSLSVEDKGPGFTDEALLRVFDPFFSTKDSGTGLGLSIVKRLMESSGGGVRISNLKTGGASVRLIFGEGDENTDSGR